MATTPGFAHVIAGTRPVFAAFLIPHILAWLTAMASSAVVTVSRKGTRLHVRAGTAYVSAIVALTAIRGSRDLPVFPLGVLALALAGMGRHARQHPRARPWRAWPGHGSHILAMTNSYTVMLTAFLIDNGKNPPLAGRLPTAASWLLPAALAAPLITWSLRRHRGPEPASRSARAAGAAGPPGACPMPGNEPGRSAARTRPHPGDTP